MKKICLLAGLFGISVQAVSAQITESQVLALGRTLVDQTLVSSLHTVQSPSGETELIGEIGLDCIGLQSTSQGDLFSICVLEDFYQFTRIDPQTAQPEALLPLLPVTVETEDGLRLNGIRDFVLTEDRIGVMTTHLIDLPLLPPGGSEFQVYERSSGELLVTGPASPLNLADSDEQGLTEAIFRSGGVTRLGQVDLKSGQGETFGALSPPFAFRDFVRFPDSGQLLAIAVSVPDNQVPFLALINDGNGEVTTLGSVPADLAYLTVAGGGAPPPDSPESPERILPILQSGRVQGGLFSSHITLLNTAGTAEQEVMIDFFDSSGEPIDPAVIICPGQGQALSLPLPAANTRTLDLAGVPNGTSGWARLKADGRVGVSTEVLLAVGAMPDCGSPATSLPSGRIQTTVQVPAVVPARRWAAQGVITPNRESAFSLVNPDLNQNIMVTVTAFDAQGQNFDINEIELLPGERVSNLLFELLNRGKVFVQPPQRPDDFRGSVTITSDHPIAAAGLTVLLPEGKWSNLPVRPVGNNP